MTVLDAYPMVDLLLDGGCAEEVQAVMQADNEAAISSLNLAEVVDKLTRRTRLSGGELASRLRPLLEEALRVVPLELSISMEAGELRARHYRRTGSAVSMADCVACVTASRLDGQLATADAALATMARAEGVTVVALPDSSGERP